MTDTRLTPDLISMITEIRELRKENNPEALADGYMAGKKKGREEI